MDWTGCNVVGLGGGLVRPRVAKLVALDYWHGLEEAKIAQRRGLRLSQVEEIIAFAFPLRPDEYGCDWTGCEEVEQVRNKVSSVPILKHTRLQAGAVVDNFKSGGGADIANHHEIPARTALTESSERRQFLLPTDRHRLYHWPEYNSSVSKLNTSLRTFAGLE